MVYPNMSKTKTPSFVPDKSGLQDERRKGASGGQSKWEMGILGGRKGVSSNHHTPTYNSQLPPNSVALYYKLGGVIET